MKLPFAFAKRFVAGEELSTAIEKVRHLNEKGIKVTLDLLGENVTDRNQAEATVDSYIDLIKRISDTGLDSGISIKLTMTGLDIDLGFCKEGLHRLLDAARAENQFVRIDMEGSDYTQTSVDVFKEVLAEYGSKHVGLVVQAYLKRTEQDVKDLAALGSDLRLCKGAYNESPQIALKNMSDIRAAYKEYAKILLEQTPYTRLATHDDKLLDWIKSYTTEQGIDKSKFEIQMLYGLREKTIENLAADGYNTRVYVPYGTEWIPYFTRRLAERKENVWFVLSTMLRG